MSDNANANTNANATDATPEVLAALMREYDKIDQDRTAAMASVERLTAARSEVLIRVRDLFGPWVNRDGRDLTIVQRGGTVFLKGASEKKGVVVP